MKKRTKQFIILYVIIEIVLIAVGMLYIYVAGSCFPGGVCPNMLDVIITGFSPSIIFGIIAPVFLYGKTRKNS